MVVRREHFASAVPEVMSRFAVDPRWLVHLPPTMSPATSSQREGLLEHPDQAFDDYAGMGVTAAAAAVARRAGRRRPLPPPPPPAFFSTPPPSWLTSSAGCAPLRRRSWT